MIELSQQRRMSEAKPLSPSGENVAARLHPVESASFKKLVATTVRFVAPVLGLSFVFIFGTALLSGFDRPMMAEKVAGAFNVGYLLVVLMYCLSWAAASCYVYVAHRQLDAQAERAILDARAEEQS